MHNFPYDRGVGDNMRSLLISITSNHNSTLSVSSLIWIPNILHPYSLCRWCVSQCRGRVRSIDVIQISTDYKLYSAFCCRSRLLQRKDYDHEALPTSLVLPKRLLLNLIGYMLLLTLSSLDAPVVRTRLRTSYVRDRGPVARHLTRGRGRSWAPTCGVGICARH